MRNNDYRYMRYVGERYFDNRFSTIKEVKDRLKVFDMESLAHEVNTGGTPLINEGGKVYLDNSDTHTLIIGSTGSMKSRAFIMPTIISLGLSGENMVVSDPKGELFNMTSGFLKSLGYKVNVLNFRNFEQSDCWNPLHEAYKLYEQGNLGEAKLIINDIANIFIGDTLEKAQEKFWPMAARDFISGTLSLLFYTAQSEEEVHISSLKPFLVRSLAEKGSDLQKEFFNLVSDLPDVSTTKLNLSSSVLNADATKRGVLGHVSSAVNAFIQSRDIDSITARNTIDLHQYAEDDLKIITYIIVPDEKTTFHFFCSLFVKQLYEVLIKEASMKKGLKLKNRVNFILDEFANIPAIPEMSNMISAARSRNIRFFLVLQSDAQLKKKYGEEEAQNIKTNCQIWCFLNSKELPLIDEVIGYIGVDSQDGNKPLMTPGDISRLEKKWNYVDSIVIMNRFRPFISTLCDISTYKIAFKNGEPIYPPVEKVSEAYTPVDFDYEERIGDPYDDDKHNFLVNLALKEDPYISKKILDKLGKKDDDFFGF